ncbi:FAD linked oxidase N-terminal [Penicillium bovifimosum]|uniref:FAD linked oxidase N-terminal n=1 Tax=Penicillium bovifimosum TaxID=126998 RepID=A0A9W9GIW3_9EURO|nr:FAD linked oxidase N-terminal [Penicillium bovifimosum]KAJ5121031.1 FAD linked oxidase N-terminal [Penicillium bovifimosum]
MFGSNGWRAFALSLALAPTALAADICKTLKAGGVEIQSPLSLSYTSELRNYWSTACGDLKPNCIAAPSSAAEMAQIIKNLHNADTLFAIKSGGHMPNNGFASIQDGLLISTKNLDQVDYNPKDHTAIIGPGLTWEEAQKGLDGTGRTIVGGRMGGVGVGGYMLGGGMSFLSTQYGWAANNVIDFEVVLANGTIVHATETQHPDLFMSLKGGGNNFGVVTAYTMQTHPQDHKVWGGNYIFTSDKTPQLLEAVRKFTDEYPDDKGAIILTAERGLVIDFWIMFLFYDGPEPPAGVFDEFTAIPHTSTTKTWNSYYDLLKNNDFFILQGQRYVIATETTPLPNSTVGAVPLQEYYDHWKDVSKSVLGVAGALGSIAFQPMPKTYSEKAKARGGDLMSIPDDQAYIIIELNFSYGFAIDDNKIDAATVKLYQGMDNLIQKNIKKGLLPDVYRPLFMNDAYHRQDYWGRIHPDSKALALKTRKAYDPQGFFQKRTSGGWRLKD